MTNNVGLDRNSPSMNLHLSSHTGRGSKKCFSLLGNNVKVGRIALGAIALLVVTGSAFTAKSLWFDPSENTTLLKFGPDLPPHLSVCSNFDVFNTLQCEAPWSLPQTTLNNKTPLEVQPLSFASSSDLTSHESIFHCLDSAEPATCGHTVLNNLDGLVKLIGSERSKILEVYSRLLGVNHDWASELALTCLRAEADCFPLDNIWKLDNSHTVSLALACTQFDNKSCNKIVNAALNQFTYEDLSYVRDIFESCLLSNSSQCRELIRTVFDLKQNYWLSVKVAEACTDSKEVACHNVALNTFNDERYFVGIEKKIIDLIFSNIKFLKDKHNELLNRTILKLISYNSHPNIEYILRNYGVEKFLNYFGKILTTEFLEKYPALIKRLALDCLHCKSQESKQFLITAFDSIKKVSYYRHELVLACLDSKENNCKQLILDLLPLLLQNKEAHELVEKCTHIDTDVCETVIQKALEPVLNGIDDSDYAICLGSKTKACIDIMLKIFTASTESHKGNLDFYCSQEEEVKPPRLNDLDPIAASRALTIQTACSRLYHSREFQDFKNPPSLLTQAKRILWKS